MRNLSLAVACCCVLAPSFFALADVGKEKPSLGVTSEAQGAIPHARIAPNEYEIRLVEYNELSKICLEIYREHVNSQLMLLTVGAAIIGYAISSRLNRRALLCAIAVGLGLCWFSLARHINYSRTVRAPMEYRLYNLERSLGIKVWQTSRPLMVYMWKPPSGEHQDTEEIEASKLAHGLGILVLVLLAVSGIGVIILPVFAFVRPDTPCARQTTDGGKAR